MLCFGAMHEKHFHIVMATFKGKRCSYVRFDEKFFPSQCDTKKFFILLFYG